MAPRLRVGIPTFLACLAAFLVPLSRGFVGPDERWKRQNDRGNRYEGAIEVPAGNIDLELVSLTGFRETFDRDADLKVRFFCRPMLRPSSRPEN